MNSKVQADNTDELELFAARLKAAMSRKGVVLRQVAEVTGKGVSTVGSWTQGKNWPEAESLILISKFLGVSLDHLVSNSAVIATDRVESVGEDQAAYGSAKEITAEIYRLMDQLVQAAGGDPGRLGWIREQIFRRLEVPDHWDIHERVIKQVVEEQRIRAEREATEAQSKKRSHGGAA